MKIILFSLLALQALHAGAVSDTKWMSTWSNSLNDAMGSLETLGAAPAAAPGQGPAAAPTFEVATQAPTADEDVGAVDDDSEDDDKDDACSEQEDREAKVVQELAANLREQAALKKTMRDLGNKDQSNEEIEEYAKQVANQTESQAMAHMLERMWKEQRMFEYPAFVEYAEKEIKDLKREEKKLVPRLSDVKSELQACRSGKPIGKAVEKESTSPKPSALDEDLEKIVDDIDGEGPPATWNVNIWKMNPKQRREAFASSFIYLLCGILVAFLYKYLKSKKPGLLLPEVRSDKLPNPNNFTFGLFDCFGSPKLCLFGCFCPCLMWADTLDRKKLLSYWPAFGAFFGLLWLHIYTGGISTLCIIILGVFYRQKLRGVYKMKKGTAETLCLDTLVWTCCQPCAIIQEAREDFIIRGNAEPAAEAAP